VHVDLEIPSFTLVSRHPLFPSASYLPRLSPYSSTVDCIRSYNFTPAAQIYIASMYLNGSESERHPPLHTLDTERTSMAASIQGEVF
jgi:hypothetical protein